MSEETQEIAVMNADSPMEFRGGNCDHKFGNGNISIFHDDDGNPKCSLCFEIFVPRDYLYESLARLENQVETLTEQMAKFATYAEQIQTAIEPMSAAMKNSPIGAMLGM